MLMTGAFIRFCVFIEGKSGIWASGRAFRCNLFAWRKQKGFPLQSLTQNLASVQFKA